MHITPRMLTKISLNVNYLLDFHAQVQALLREADPQQVSGTEGDWHLVPLL
jgi:hypothetical protein